jgi:hypothetical protein
VGVSFEHGLDVSIGARHTSCPPDADRSADREVPVGRPCGARLGLIRLGLALAVITGCILPLHAAHAAPAEREAVPLPIRNTWVDPLAPMIRRIDDYLQESQVDGVTMDWRYSVIPSEEIRQTVVCQLLAYVELARLDPRARLRAEILRHADFP